MSAASTLPISEEQSLAQRRLRFASYCALVIVFTAVYLGSLFFPPLLDDADSTHAEAAREMFISGDYVTLHVNGVRYLEKAPLPYWLVAFGYRLFGVNEFATRLPMALSVLLLGVLALVWSRGAFGERAGVYAAMFVSTAAGVFLFTRILIPDVLLSLLIAASLYFFLTALETDVRAWRWYAGYACMAHEHFLRFLGKRYPHDYNKLPWALYWSLHLVWLFPWSLYLPAAIRTVIDSRKEKERSHFASRTRLMCWILAGLVLIFFAVSTNQEYYTFPAYLPLLMLLADGVARCESTEGATRTRKGWLRVSSGVLAAVGLAAGITLLALLWRSRHLPFEPDIGNVLAKHDMDTDTLSTSHMLDLSYESFAALRLPAALAAIAFITAPLASWMLRMRRRHYAATMTVGLGMAVFLVAAHIALARFGPYLSSKDLAHEIAARARPDDRVMIYGDQAFGSSLLFYLQRPMELVEGKTTSMWFGSTFPDAPRIYLSDSDLVQDWGGKNRIFLFVPSHLKGRVDSLLPTRIIVAEVSGKCVYSNYP